MELYPTQNLSATSSICLGLLYDTEVPASGEKSLHTAINDAIAMRLFQRTTLTSNPARWQYQPLDVSAFNTGRFLPAWLEHDGTANGGYGGAFSTKTRIIPKIKLPAVDARFANTVNAYLEAVAACLLAHRMILSNDYFLANVANNLSPQYNLTDEGWYLCAEYDFGAEIELGALVGYSMGAAAAASMVLGTQQTYLQAQVNGVWTDVIHTYDNLRTTSNNVAVTYELPTRVTAQKFRVVNKAGTWPWSTTGHYPFGIQFFAKYTGQKPRTLGKYKHMTVLHLQALASYTASTTWYFNWPAVLSTVQSRYCSMMHLTITDDIKQVANFDINMLDATYNTAFGLLPPVPTFRVQLASIIGRGV